MSKIKTQKASAAADATAAVATIVENSGIKLTDIRISNFRSLLNVETTLSDLTALVGANNVGKTSFLDALYAAIGAGRKNIGPEDIYISNKESTPPKERYVTIDIKIHPVDDNDNIIQNFPEGSFWTSIWGAGISQDDDFKDYVAMRTTLRWSHAYGEYRFERKFLKEWLDFKDWLNAAEKGNVSAADIEPLALHYIDAKRDLDEDFRKQGSFWRKLTDDLGLSDKEIEEFESVLNELNERIVDKSSVLKHLATDLNAIQSVISDQGGHIEIAPVSRKMRDLSRGIDISITGADSASFPLSKHGMGTRSLASLLVFRAFSTWKTQQAQSEGDKVHVLLGLEEPEAHLHPQSQRALFSQIKSIRGQRIVSTHSPYFAGQVQLEDIRLLTKNSGITRISKLPMEQLDKSEKDQLQYKVIDSKGDLLFSKGLLLFEGETEEKSLPIWAEKYWGANIHELGFNFVSVNGSGGYYPYIWLAQSLNIPWFILSDAELDTVNKLKRQIKKVFGTDELDKIPQIVLLNNQNNFEQELVANGYLPEIEAAFNEVFSNDDYIANYIAQNQGLPKKGGVLRDYNVANGRALAALDALNSNKTLMAIPVATQITNIKDEKRVFPGKIEQIFEQMSAVFNLKKKS